MRKRGFTMTEVLIVVVILGVLAALVIPRFFGQSERGVVAEAVGMLSAIRQAEEAYSLEQSAPAYTSTLTNLDIDLTQTNFTYAVTVAAGPTFTATATRSAACTGQCCPGKTITLTKDGVFGGTHPFGPNPDAGATC